MGNLKREVVKYTSIVILKTENILRQPASKKANV